MPILILLMFAPVVAQESNPTDHIGRVLPMLKLLTGDEYRGAKITEADADGITIDVDGQAHHVSRFALPVEARVALGFPADPMKLPGKEIFRVMQSGKRGYIVRIHTPAAAQGSMQALNNQIFGRTPAIDDPGKDGDQLFLLKGKCDEAIADRELMSAYYVRLDETETLTNTEGVPVTLRVMILVKGRRYVP